MRRPRTSSAPPVWTSEELAGQAAVARALFRAQRLEEPLETWKRQFEGNRARFELLFARYAIGDPSRLLPSHVPAIFADQLSDALRYLAGPPISADDLAVLSEVESVAPARLQADPEAAERILSTIIQALDRTRMPWLAQGRGPTDAEMSAAILASAALITAQQVATGRRTQDKDRQERAVRDFLLGMNFVEARGKPIRTLDDAPDRGAYYRETLVGTRKADLPVRLFDGRLMLVECKVSNSALNSVKRINNDAAVKARTWKEEFGRSQVVPVAVLSGVFKVANLAQAQAEGLTLFWAHDLGAVRAFIEATR